MRIGYITHAKEQMRNRGISKKQVKDAIINGQKRYLQKNNRIKCIYKNKNTKLIVIYKQDKENYKVITTFYPYEN